MRRRTDSHKQRTLNVEQSAVSRVSLLLRGRRRAVAALAAVSVVGGLSEALFLVVATRTAFAVTNQSSRVPLFGGHDISRGLAIAVGFGLVLVRTGLAVLGAQMAAELSANSTAQVRRRLASAFLRSSWGAQESSRSGRLQELLTTFAARGAELVNSVAGFVVALFNLMAMLGLAVLVDPAASMMVIVAVVVLGSVLRPVRAALRRQARETAGTGMSFATSLNEISQLGQEMHIFGVQGQTETRVHRTIDSDAKALTKLGFLRGVLPAVYTGLAYLALSGSVAAVSASGVTNIASMGAVMLVMLRSLGYGQALQNSSASINATLPFVASLEEELDYFSNAAIVDHGESLRSIGSLAFDHVSFQYSDDAPVLHDVTFTISLREAIGVVGPSGSGKSTLVQLLLGLYQPTSGRVTSDGRDIHLLSRDDWVRSVAFVPQQARFLNGSIRDNIRFLRDDVSDEQVIDAAKLAHLHDDIVGWPEGYDRAVGTLGGNLSGGQQQRVIIARALVERPDVMILDEPTSALDVRSEALVLETLQQLRQKMTIIVIAHRLSTLEICDRIMVIQDGQMKYFDSPVALRSLSTYYADSLALAGLS